jgi:hypothetical protein
MFRDSSLEIEVLQDMLEDMVPVMEVIVTEEMFDHYRKAVDYAMKTWVQYWQVTRDDSNKDEKMYYFIIWITKNRALIIGFLLFKGFNLFLFEIFFIFFIINLILSL